MNMGILYATSSVSQDDSKLNNDDQNQSKTDDQQGKNEHYIMELLRHTFKPKLKKIKKIQPGKILIFQEMELSGPKKLNKTPLGETGCLSNR